MIETKITQCQIQIHDENDVAKFHGQWCQMLQIDPEALVLKFYLHQAGHVDIYDKQLKLKVLSRILTNILKETLCDNVHVNVILNDGFKN